jgi:hypothetical protein
VSCSVEMRRAGRFRAKSCGAAGGRGAAAAGNCHVSKASPGLVKDRFVAARIAQVFADRKPFADAVSKWHRRKFLARFDVARPVSRQPLKEFVIAKLLIVGARAPANTSQRTPRARYIDPLWDQLTCSSTQAPRYCPLLPLPEPDGFGSANGMMRELMTPYPAYATPDAPDACGATSAPS